MTTIPPSIPTPVAALAGSADLTALLTQLPPDLQSVGRGTMISGTVVAVDSQGQVLLQTGAGIVGFQGLVSVSVGQQVTLQVQSTAGGQVQALILAAEAKAMDEIAAAGGTAQAPDAAPAETPAPAATVAASVMSGSVIVATVIARAPGGQSTAPPVPSSSTGTDAGAGAATALQGTPAAPAPAAGAASSPASPAAATTSAPPTLSPPTPASPPTALGAAPSAGGSAASAPPPAPATATSTPAQSVAPSAPPMTATATSAQQPVASSAATPPPASLTPTPTPTPTPAPASATPAADAAPPTRAVSTAIASYAASATAGTATTASTPPASASAAPLPAPPPGTLVPLRFVGALPTLAAAAAGASSGHVVATVVARTAAGQMIVDTAIGRLAFAAPADAAPVGSQIAFEIAAPALRPLAAAAGTAPLTPGRGLAGLTAEWPALKDAVSTLATIDPALAQQVVETVIPQLGNPRFVAQVLAFLATSVDDVKALLGQAAMDALLQTGHGDVLGRLQADINEMSRLNASATDWQVYYLPLLDPTQIRQLRVYTRRRKAGADRQRDSGRFVVEFEFESLGPLQLDGLVQKPRLDLILRSHGELPGALRSGISEVFARTCEAAGLSGKLFFQAQPSFPVSPFEEMSRSPISGVSV